MIVFVARVSARALTGRLCSSAPSHNSTRGSIPCSPVKFAALAQPALLFVHWFGFLLCLHNLDAWLACLPALCAVFCQGPACFFVVPTFAPVAFRSFLVFLLSGCSLCFPWRRCVDRVGVLSSGSHVLLGRRLRASVLQTLRGTLPGRLKLGTALPCCGALRAGGGSLLKCFLRVSM